MSYLSRRLAPGESVVRVGRYHFFQKIWPWIALLLLGIIIVGIIIWARELMRMGTTRMLVTNRRVMLKKGFFAIKVDELTLGSIEGAHIEQSILGRVFGYGKLRVKGRGETEMQFPTMDRPDRFRAAMEEARIKGEVQRVEVAPPADETSRERKRRLKREVRPHA